MAKASRACFPSSLTRVKFCRIGVSARGYTRARRYANHPGGRKYAPGTREVLPFREDTVKAEAAMVFRERWEAVKADPNYQRMLKEHKIRAVSFRE